MATIIPFPHRPPVDPSRPAQDAPLEALVKGLKAKLGASGIDLPDDAIRQLASGIARETGRGK
jgi:hypothetical protein